MSGIFSVRPAALRCIDVSMNWYFLSQHHLSASPPIATDLLSDNAARGSSVELRPKISFLRAVHSLRRSRALPHRACSRRDPLSNGDLRNHLLKLVHGRFDVGTGCDIVLDLVDERRVGYASRVGGRIFPGGRSFALAREQTGQACSDRSVGLTRWARSCPWLPYWELAQWCRQRGELRQTGL